jgi:gas vesicle structural protein
MAIAERQARPHQTYMAQQGMGRGGPSGLADVLEVLLDKGLVIDAFVRVSLVGIELLTIDARIVVASVDTYLRFAEAVNRLDLLQANNSQQLGDILGPGSSSRGSNGERSRALSEHGSSDDAHSDDEPGSSERDDDDRSSPAPVSSSDARDDDANGRDADDDKGLLTRIKERGQVF